MVAITPISTATSRPGIGRTDAPALTRALVVTIFLVLSSINLILSSSSGIVFSFALTTGKNSFFRLRSKSKPTIYPSFPYFSKPVTNLDTEKPPLS